MTSTEERDRRSPTRAKATVFGREVPLPRSRSGRVAVGIALVCGGLLGFLPVLGFWMAPLGLIVLSYEFHVVRRLRRRFVVWRERRRGR
jgi:purine-cytosine permease-like protein